MRARVVSASSSSTGARLQEVAQGTISGMHRAALTAALTASPPRAALVLDFDGVLAPISADPAASTLDLATADALARLATRLGVVAVLSGRPLSFLQERADVAGLALHGSYGVQWSGPDGEHVLAEVAAWQPAIDTATAALHARFDDAEGVHVEDKGIGVAVHWRRAPDRAAAAERVAEVTADLAGSTGLGAEPGKMVIELRPPLGEDKGTALHRIAGQLAFVAYLGDDLGDLPAMAAARALGGCAVAVAHGAETDPRLLAAADVVLDGTAEVAAWLSELAGTLEP